VPTTTTTEAPLDPLSQNCDGANNPAECYEQAACTEWASVDSTVQRADQNDDGFTDLQLQNKQVYINMLNDATLGANDNSKYQLLEDRANAIDNAINNIGLGNQQPSLDGVAVASERMGSECHSFGL
jgi:hypothetical protein